MLENSLGIIIRAMFARRFDLLVVAVLGCLVVILGIGIFWLFVKNQELAARSGQAPVVFYSLDSNSSFLDASDVKNSEAEAVAEARQNLIQGEKDFIDVNLSAMQITLYDTGKPIDTLPLKAKGREGSFWETSTGIYAVGNKTANHFSSISKVWMPYGIQFYGNFFLHGWPYYEDGTPLPAGNSGGCIRMATEDAKIVYQFARPDMPILVFENAKRRAAYPALVTGTASSTPIPELSANVVLVADLDTSEMVVGKNVDTPFALGEVTHLMTALVASEVVNLEKSITLHAYMRDDRDEVPFTVGARYRGFDLLYPLLMRSSKTAASALGGFLGSDAFTGQMNKKAKALGMQNTVFIDVTGNSPRNVSTLKDLAKLVQYVVEKRPFLFGVSLGANYPREGSTGIFANLENGNGFAQDPALFGAVQGNSDEETSTELSVWRFEKGNFTRTILIALEESQNSTEDTRELLEWLEENFSLEPLPA